MIIKQEHNGFIKVEEYSLSAWLAEVETVINQGYTFNFESNDTHPQVFGSMYTVLMVPVATKDTKDTKEQTDDNTDNTEDEPEVQIKETLEVVPVVEQPVQTKRKNARS